MGRFDDKESTLDQYDGIRTSIVADGLLDEDSSHLVIANGSDIYIYSLGDGKSSILPPQKISCPGPIYGITEFSFNRPKRSYTWLAVGLREEINFYAFDKDIQSHFLVTNLPLRKAPGKYYNMVPNTLKFVRGDNWITHFTEEHHTILHNHIGKAYDNDIHKNFEAAHKKGLETSSDKLFRQPEVIEHTHFGNKTRDLKFYTYDYVVGDPDNIVQMIYRERDQFYLAQPSLKVRNFEKYFRVDNKMAIQGPVGKTLVALKTNYRGTLILLKNGIEFRSTPDYLATVVSETNKYHNDPNVKVTTEGDVGSTYIPFSGGFEWDPVAAIENEATGDIMVFTRPGDIYAVKVKERQYTYTIEILDVDIKKLNGKVENVTHVLSIGQNEYVVESEYEFLRIKYESESSSINILQNISELRPDRDSYTVPPAEARYFTIDDYHLVVEKGGCYILKGTKLHRNVEHAFPQYSNGEHDRFLDVKKANHQILILTREGLLSDDEPLIGGKIKHGLILPDGTLLYYQDSKINYGPAVISFTEPLTALAAYHHEGKRLILAGTSKGELYQIIGKDKNKVTTVQGAIISLFVKEVGSKSFIFLHTEDGMLHIYDDSLRPLRSLSTGENGGAINFTDVSENTVLYYNEWNLVKVVLEEAGKVTLSYLEVGSPIRLVIYDKREQKLIITSAPYQKYIEHLSLRVFDPSSLKEFVIEP